MPIKSTLDISHFVQRTGMYVQPVDLRTVTSFIDGYETGLGNTELTDSIKNYLISNYDIEYSSDGWPGQIQRFGDTINLSWLDTFKKVVREMLESDSF